MSTFLDRRSVKLKRELQVVEGLVEILLLLLRLVAKARKGLYYDCVYPYKDQDPIIYSSES
jgi:hypothetical protein